VFVRRRIIQVSISSRSRLHLMICQGTRRIDATRKNSFIYYVPMGALSREQWEAHHNATYCHICEKPFTPDDTRIRDHCHLTGRYRGPAHSNCNLNYKNSFYSYSFPQFIRLRFALRKLLPHSKAKLMYYQ